MSSTARNLYRSFMLATNCLMRVGAIYALPLDAIDLEARVIRVRDVPELGWKNKGSKWPNKPISQRLYEFLKEDLANRLLNDGESPQKVQQLADHADIQTTMRYYNTREASSAVPLNDYRRFK
jgi:integrase